MGLKFDDGRDFVLRFEGLNQTIMGLKYFVRVYNETQLKIKSDHNGIEIN